MRRTLWICVLLAACSSNPSTSNDADVVSDSDEATEDGAVEDSSSGDSSSGDSSSGDSSSGDSSSGDAETDGGPPSMSSFLPTVDKDTLTYGSSDCGDANDQTWCAATCAVSDFSDAFSAMDSAGGGVVFLPRCSPNPTIWASGIRNTSTTNEFYIEGYSQSETSISLTSGGPMFEFQNPACGFRGLAHLTVSADAAGGAVLMLKTANDPPIEVDVHHVTSSGMHPDYTFKGVYGVFHQNTLNPPKENFSYGIYVMGNPAWGWPLATPPWGTRDAFFIEDNTFYEHGHIVSGFCGSRIVFRNNTWVDAVRGFSAGGIDMHGPGFGGSCWPAPDGVTTFENGGRSMEAYNNVITSGDRCEHYAFYARTGSWLIYGNEISDFAHLFRLTLNANENGPDCTSVGTLDDYDNNNCSDVGDGCCHRVQDVYVDSNTYQLEGTAFTETNACGGESSIVGFEGTGSSVLMAGEGTIWHEDVGLPDGYVAFTYPHPLR